jgi:hypothetical protein
MELTTVGKVEDMCKELVIKVVFTQAFMRYIQKEKHYKKILGSFHAKVRKYEYRKEL